MDADLGYEQFFQQWRPVLGQVLEGDLNAGHDLHLQVTAYGEDNAFAARILERRRLNSSDPAAGTCSWTSPAVAWLPRG